LELVPKDRQRVKEKKQVDLVGEETQIIFSTQFYFFLFNDSGTKEKIMSLSYLHPFNQIPMMSHP
jgi:hypothetical protein